jgi:hypothetical protein
MLQKAIKLVWFTFINKNGMIIMYLHIGVNKLLLEVFHYGNVFYTIVGITFPVLFSIFVLEKRDIIYKFFIQRFSFAGNEMHNSHRSLARKTMSGKNIKVG